MVDVQMADGSLNPPVWFVRLVVEANGDLEDALLNSVKEAEAAVFAAYLADSENAEKKRNAEEVLKGLLRADYRAFTDRIKVLCESKHPTRKQPGALKRLLAQSREKEFVEFHLKNLGGWSKAIVLHRAAALTATFDAKIRNER